MWLVLSKNWKHVIKHMYQTGVNDHAFQCDRIGRSMDWSFGEITGL